MIVDLGTGDGNFVYQSAKENPGRFYIGIDAEVQTLRENSARAARKAAKGGLPNVLFVAASLEHLPPELDGVADEVHVHFPWGSLLKAVATGEPLALASLRRLCAAHAWIEVVTAPDPVRDAAELARLGLEGEPFGQAARARYREAAFHVAEHGTLAASKWPHLRTSWAKRLQGRRPLSYLVAQAI